MQQNATHPPLEISDDKGRLDVPLIHRFLSEEAYWSLGIPTLHCGAGHQPLPLRSAAMSTASRWPSPGSSQTRPPSAISPMSSCCPPIAAAVTARRWWRPLSTIPPCRGCAASCWPPRMPTASMPVLASRHLASPRQPDGDLRPRPSTSAPEPAPAAQFSPPAHASLSLGCDAGALTMLDWQPPF
jgi:hypothetical protein